MTTSEMDSRTIENGNFSSESDEGQELTSLGNEIHGSKELRFQPDKLPWRDVYVTSDETNETPYFLDISEFTPNTPDIVMHSKDNKGPVIGECHFKWGGAIHCGLGSDNTSMEWTDFERVRGVHRSFHFVHKGQQYTLSRTSDESQGVTGYKKVLVGHYKVVDDKNGEPLAVYIKESVGRRRGVLKIKRDLDSELEKLIVLGVAAWREKMRRKTNLGGRRVF